MLLRNIKIYIEISLGGNHFLVYIVVNGIKEIMVASKIQNSAAVAANF